jgi:hypothetical protein
MVNFHFFERTADADPDLTVEEGYGNFCEEVVSHPEGRMHINVLITFLKFMRFKEKNGLSSKYSVASDDD